jgi:hypothetical protein
MTTENPDPLDTELQQLFAAVAPSAGFEDRLVTAVRSHQRLRLTIPLPARKAAIAAAAVLAVGSVGYFGSRVMPGKPMLAQIPNNVTCASNLHQLGLAVLQYEDPFSPKADPSKWDFGGGSNSALNWSDRDGDNKLKNGWQLKNPDATYAIGSDINRGSVAGSSSTAAAFDSRMDLGVKNKAGRFGLSAPSANYFDSKGQKPLEAGRQVVIGGLVQNARELADAGKFTESLTAVDQIKKLDTSNAYAAEVDHSLEDRAANQVRRYPVAAATSIDGQNTYMGKTTISSETVQLGDTAVVLAPPTAANPPVVTALSPADAPADESAKGGERGEKSPTSPSSAVPATQPTDDRKIIRTGTMEFEIDRFDAAQMQITKIVGELGGFVGATDSQKLPNGKVRGSISVRVPPERLDTLVLSLRALGDLKSQQITASDITKEYTDLESELAADRAMQDRLLDLIHGGKGTIKDLLAAENELGVWRGKIEKAEGMIRYYNGQVALSTLTLTLSERDIQTPATAVETETADVGIEADDVEKARASALKAVDDAKGRIVEAELKRYDAGQLACRLVADVPPESAGAVIDQLKLLGKVARLEVHRQQTTKDGTSAVAGDTPLHTERKPTRLLISIYNLANVAPRRTTNVNLAATDVESAYTALTSAAKSSGGRVVTSNLDRGDPVKATGSLTLEFPPDKFELAMTALHAQGDVLKLTLTENPDTQNSTEAKQGLTVQLVSLASVPARETMQQTIAAGDVPAAYQAVLSAISAAHARVQSAQLNEQDRQNITADLELELPRIAEADFDKAVAAAGGTIARTSSQSADAEGTVDSKIQLHLSITSSDHLAPRETTKLQVEVADVDKSAGDIQAAAFSAGGRVLEATVSKDHGKGTARIVLDLPLEKTGDILQQTRGQGTVRGIDSSRDPQAPSGPMAHGQLFIEFDTPDAIVADQTSPWASVRQGLSTSVTGLLWSLQWVIVGLCLIGPWAGIGWIAWKVKARLTKAG